ncbi:MAG TPA: TetR/AcrR family transcriptional regulator, partial [Tepidisphaeraceae bacterium]
ATSVDDICAAAKVTKGSFFHYYRSKDELAREAVTRFYESSRQAFAAAPYRKEADPLRRVHGYLDFLAQLSRGPMAKGGCLIGTLAHELGDSNETMRQTCAECFADWAAALRADFAAAKAKYAPRARWSPHGLADHCIAVIEGGLILVRSSGDPAVLQESVAHLRRYVMMLFDDNDSK